MSRRRWAIFISGRGSNLAALLETRDEVEIRLVVSSSSTATGLARAKRAGVATAVTPFKVGKQGRPVIDWMELDQLLRRAGITHIFLAGFMKVIPASFVDLWAGRVLNLHPSLLPKYPGLESITRAVEARDDVGLSVHEVTSEVDAGKVLLQRRCLKSVDVQNRLAARHSLNAARGSEYSLTETHRAIEFKVHVDEQRAVKEAIRLWNRWPMS